MRVSLLLDTCSSGSGIAGPTIWFVHGLESAFLVL
jgi:hypothetical protein